MSNCQLYEDIEDLIYGHTNKNTLNFIEYENKYKKDLKDFIDIKSIQKIINLLNKTQQGE